MKTQKRMFGSGSVLGAPISRLAELGSPLRRVAFPGNSENFSVGVFAQYFIVHSASGGLVRRGRVVVRRSSAALFFK